MSAKKWLIMFAIAVFLAVLAVAAFNVAVDPFGVFGDRLLDWYSYDETNNPRVAKIAYLEREHGRYDSYVIGSSSAASFDVEELDRYFGARFYNLFVYGCDTKDYEDFAAYLLEHYEVKNLVLNFGLNEATVYDEGEDSLNDRMHAKVTGKSLIHFYASYVFCNPKYAAEKLVSRFRDTELPQPFDVFDVPTGTYDKRVRDIEKIGDPDVYLAAHGTDFEAGQGGVSLPYIEECAAAAAKIRDLCAEHGVRLTVIASPTWIGQWESFGEEDLRAYRTVLAGAVDYWDFGLTPLSYDSRYFYDATHFRNAAGNMILAAIFDNGDIWRPERFGTYVTTENCAAHLDALFRDPPEIPVTEYTAEVPVLIYHHFDPQVSGDMTISPAVFEAQMKALAEAGCEAVTAADLIAYVERGEPLPEKPVLITMDDGYLSNFEVAYPILREYGLRATVFPIGVSVGSKEHYKDTDYPITPHFGWDEAREMLASGVMDIQSHSWDMHQWAAYEDGGSPRENMLPLEGESEKEYAAALAADLERYDALRRAELGEGFTALAYPSGAYEDLTEVLVHEAGIPVTFSTRTDSRNVLVKGLGQTLYALCRIIVTDGMTPAELLEAVLPKG